MLTAGASGRSATEFADAVATLGADIDASAGAFNLVVRFRGLSSKLSPTLDLLADAVRRPSLGDDDFSRERELALERIRARGDNPSQVAGLTADALLYGTDDPRGRPVAGYESTVTALSRDDLVAALPTLVDPARARFVVVGDIDSQTLAAELGSRFGDWQARGAEVPPLPEPLQRAAEPRLTMVDRPGAPQTVIYIVRPVPAPASELERTARSCLDTLFGGTFTSRLMRNLREEHGYTYGARSALTQQRNQFELIAYAAVQGDVTAAALDEFRREFQGVASGNVSAEELSKASKTVRFELVNAAETTGSLAGTLTALAADGRPMDSIARRLATLGEVDLELVNRIAQSGLYDWSSLLVVLVGDAASVRPQLENAGFVDPIMVEGPTTRP